MTYSNKNRPPRPLTTAERDAVLRVTGKHVSGFRDHMVISLALGCALRESEICALDVGDVTNDGHTIVRTIQLRVFKRAGRNTDPERQRVPVPDATHHKLERWVRTHRKGAKLDEPLFATRQAPRLTARQIRRMFRKWQTKAGIVKPYPFHALRHTCLSTMAREAGVLVASRVARHGSVATTSIYLHTTDEELWKATRRVPS